MGTRELVPRPGAFAYATDTEEKETSFRGQGQAGIVPVGNHGVILPGKVTAWYQYVDWLIGCPFVRNMVKALHAIGWGNCDHHNAHDLTADALLQFDSLSAAPADGIRSFHGRYEPTKTTPRRAL